jgi:hypothetical protein
LTVTAKVNENRLEIQKRALSLLDISVSICQLPTGQLQWTIKACEQNAEGISAMVDRIKGLAGVFVSFTWSIE